MNEDTVMMEQYLEDMLDEKSKTAFEERLHTDPELNERFSIFKTIYQQEKFSLRYGNEETTFLNTLKRVSAKKNSVIPLKTYWYYAAASVALIAMIYFVIQYQVHDKKTELYAFYAQHEEINLTQRGNNDTAILRAAVLFNSKKYDTALLLLKQHLSVQADDTEMELAAGICLLETNQFEEAMAKFEKIAAGSSLLRYNAVWYKALVCLKQGKKEACISSLKNIPETGYKYNEAQQLLKELK